MTQNAKATCTRCKGKGYGDWVVQNGICYGCQGKGTREAQIALRDAAKALQQRIRETERVSILVGPVEANTTTAASEAYWSAFAGPDRREWVGCSPIWTRLAPGWFAGETTMHVASFLAELEAAR